MAPDADQGLADLSIERAADAVFWFEEAGRIVRVNGAACKALGYGRDELMGMTVFDISPDTRPDAWPGYWSRVKRIGQLTTEVRHLTRDGRELAGHASIGYVESGRALHCAIVRYGAPAETDDRFRNLVEASVQAILVHNRDFELLFANGPAARLLGYDSVDEVIGLNLLDGSILPEDREASIRHFDRVLAGEPIENPIEAQYLRRDGSTYWAERIHAPIVWDGQLAILATATDITARKQAQAELEALKDRLAAENTYLKEELRVERHFDEIVTGSVAFKQVLSQVEQIADSESSVLITGETGTGKELIARSVHKLSRRSERPLVKVNCAALPGDLVESELFGHEKGAFTGAVTSREGRFEVADGGTLFLDEVAEMPLALQARLLRVLQEGEYQRVGSSVTRRTDVRVIAATNRDLVTEVREGRFREDLYYRLNVIPIACPPLRERKEDIPPLVRHFVDRHCTRLGREPARVSKAALADLGKYDWPGNVRELENVIERAVVLSDPGGVLKLDLPVHKEAAAGDRLSDVERAHILAVLDRCGGRIGGSSGAASALGLAPSTLRDRMRKLGIPLPRSSEK